MSSTPVDLTLRVVECLRPVLPKGSRVAVFGSCARGDAASDSDIDLLVLEPEVPDRHREMSRLSRLLGRQLIPADVVVMSTRAFDEQRDIVNSLAWCVVREGQWHEFPA
jgi:predicted nucleotidyltransferase